MSTPEKNAPDATDRAALIVLLFGVSAALVWILQPFFGTILWGAIIALLFAPVYRWLLPRLRRRRNAAALLTLAIVLLMVILPFALLSAALAREAAGFYQRIESGELDPARVLRSLFAALPDAFTELLRRFGLADFDDLQRRLSAGLAQASQFIATQALSIGQNTFEFIASLFVTLYLAFFLIRDGDAVLRAVSRAVPMAPAHKHELFVKFATVVRATVKGNVLVAALQGVLGGLAFWVLDVRGALLWGVLMAFLSMLPAVGAALVWAPVAIYFLVSGSVGAGLGLVAYGVLVIGLVDNLLRPVLVGKDTSLPDYVILMTTLGGMAVFGLHGFVVGPAIAAMFIAVWHIFSVAREQGAG